MSSLYTKKINFLTTLRRSIVEIIFSNYIINRALSKNAIPLKILKNTNFFFFSLKLITNVQNFKIYRLFNILLATQFF